MSAAKARLPVGLRSFRRNFPLPTPRRFCLARAVINATAGTVQLQANNSGGSNTVTIKANSDLVARRTG